MNQVNESKMNSGIIELDELYEFAKGDIKRLGLKAKSSEGIKFGKQATIACKDIIIERGFYIWGKYEKKNALWRTIYLGKAEKKKTASLSNRIRKELSTERLIFWCNPKTEIGEKEEDTIVDEMRTHYNQDYSKNWRVAYKKKGTSHIIWVATPEIKNKMIPDVEADLIETMNPSANIKRPKPDSELLGETIAVIREMKHLIHRYRP
jgi:hypothetical protein